MRERAGRGWLLAGVALAGLAGCMPTDWDLRPTRASTADAALAATQPRPQTDTRGVLSYPGYQVAVAQRGDTVGSVAARVGLPAAELAQANALQPGDALNSGAVLVLPRRVAEPPPGAPGSGYAVASGAPAGGAIEVTALAGAAIDRSQGAAAPVGAQPARHRVVRGETAFSVARSYGVTASALAEWNGLGPDMALREGQTLLIPTSAAAPPRAEALTAPGAGTPTPVPPSAAAPLPDEETAPAAQAQPVPASPELGSQRTTTTRMAMPVAGSIIRPYAKGRNEGIDIGAAAGSPVLAAADGTIAAITKDTDQVPIVVIRHPDNLLTVYAGLDGVRLAKGATVKRGQQIAVVRAGSPAFVHFEVRRGTDSVDPVQFLQ